MTPQNMYEAKKYEIYIGNDVDKTNFAITVRDRTQLLMRKKLPANPEQLYNFIQNHYKDQAVIVGYEAGPTGYGLYDYLEQRGQDCLLIPPLSIPKATNQKVKTNRIDSQKIAAFLIEGEFHPVRVPQGAYRELRHLIEARENYVHLRRSSKQRVKALLLYAGIEYSLLGEKDNFSQPHLEYLKKIECSEAVKYRLNQLLEDLNYARGQLLKVLRALRKFCQHQEDVNRQLRYLMSIPGIGFLTATTLLARMGDPGLLRNQRELAAFVGLVPREKSSGERVFRGSITHMGNAVLRSLLIESAWRAIRQDTQLEQFFQRIHKKHHSAFASRKAIVAVARKLTLIIYRVLKEQRIYKTHSA